jgi:hypothetical protein
LALLKIHSTNRSCKIKRIGNNENFLDEFLLIINDFANYPQLKSIVKGITDSNILTELVSKGKLDDKRGNWKIDFGFSSGQNLE